MTAPTVVLTAADAAVRGSSPEARPGSRAARLAMPRALEALKALASQHGVCVRPVSLRRTDLSTGQTEVIDLSCGATLEAKCPPCAKRARRLRQVQIREGWHRTDEPAPPPEPVTPGQEALIVLRAHFEFARADAERSARWDQVADLDAAIAEVEQAITAEGLRGRIAPPHTDPDSDDAEQGERSPRRVRSTRRREDVPELPRQRVEARTIGRTYTGTDWSVHRPSMWLTLTLDSYGPVHSIPPGRPCSCGRRHSDADPLLGTPVNPATYDYRRAAWDAVHFPRLIDRYWQNLRRAVGWNVQYAGCVEPQRRLAPHGHFAIRGTVPRTMLERVAAATYHQVWWPAASEQAYPVERPPVWGGTDAGWADPDTRNPLSTWNQALDRLDDDPDAAPAHVVRFGPQVKAKGVEQGSQHVDRTIGYITKYLTKSAAECHQAASDPQRDHLDRLWHALRVTPCSPRCANWLLYGIQPKQAHARLRPGYCKAKVHQKSTLGIGGRRVLVSRDWSGKTLADHRADAHAWVKALLGITEDQAAGVEHTPGSPAPVVWELARPGDPDVPALEHRLLRTISARIQQRTALTAARERAGPGTADFSATAPGTAIGEEECRGLHDDD